MKYPSFISMFCIIMVPLLTSCTSILVDPKIPLAPDAQSAPEMYKPPIEKEYHIRIGDKLSIRSYYDQQLNQEVVVRPDGYISVLLLNDVKVVGYTPNEFSTILSTQYAKHIRTANVTVSVIKSKELTVYVGGAVKRSAQQPLNGPLTVMQAITSAGGFLDTANTNQVIVLRHQDDGRFLAYQLDTDKILVNQAPDLYLKRFDIVHVPLSSIAHVGRFVDQYINNIIPEALRFNASYTWVEQVDDGRTQLEIVP